MPKTKIVFINIHAYPCVVGGLEVFNHYLIDELSKFYTIHIITTCKKIKQENCTIHYIQNTKYFKKVTQPLSIFLKLARLRNTIDLVHVSFSKAYWTHWFIYVVAKKLLKTKYMLTIHGGSLADWNPKWPYEMFFKHAESITGVSDRICTEYRKRSNREIINTPPLIPFQILKNKSLYRKKWNIKPDELILLYVGSIKPLKAVDSLIEALGLLNKKFIIDKKLKILIAGDGVSKNKLILRVKELKLEDSVYFLGNIPREKIPELYNLADIYTICSEYEGLPISTLEAFANKLSCITSDASGLHNLSFNNKNSLLFKTRDSKDYADKLKLLINDEKLQKRLKENGYLYYQSHFSYQTLVNKFKHIIDL